MAYANNLSAVVEDFLFRLAPGPNAKELDDVQKASSEKHHTHTTGQVILIAHLSTIQTLEPGGQTEMTVFRPVLYVLEYKTNTFRAKALCAQCIHLRAPPFYC